MSEHENTSFSPINGLDGRQDRIRQNWQDPQASTNGFGSPSPRTSQAGYQPQASTSASAAKQGTAPAWSYEPPRQPINDAVTSAVHTTDSKVSPELIQLITQNVIQQLNVHSTTVPPSVQPVQPPSNVLDDQPVAVPSSYGSPVIDRAIVYTPPSPHRPEEKLAESGSIPTMPTVGSFDVAGYETTRGRDVSPFSRASNEEAILSEVESRSSRPEAPRRLSTDPNATVLEKYWGKLFDEEGQSTERLQNFLEGVALQLIENYEPKNSLVITPDKMQRFYEDTRLEERAEIYPWKLVFDDKTSYISRLLRERDIKVQHHLIQSTPDARPNIPGLTPCGFASWMVMLIKAHPDHEHERLAKVLKIMAVSHPQDRSQRFPAAISRRLFPPAGDETIAYRLTELVAEHCKVQVNSRHNSATVPMGKEPTADVPQSPRKTEVPPAPTVEDAADESETPRPHPSQQPKDSGVSFTTTEPNTSKVRDMPFDQQPSKAHSVTSIEDESDVPIGQPPIERQRQPYVAHPGGGKTYDLNSSGDEKIEQPQTYVSEMDDLRRTKSVSNPQRPRVPPLTDIHQRPEAQPPQPDSADLSRSRYDVTGGQTAGSMHRTRSNSTHERDVRPSRRTRSNSTYVNDAGTRYHQDSQRSPPFSKSGFDLHSPRATEPILSYPTYAKSSNRPTSTYQPPITDRYDYSRHPPYDHRDPTPRYKREESRDLERSHDPNPRSRPRFQSSAGQDAYPSPDDYYRSQQAYANANTNTNGVVVVQPAGGGGPYHQYPPTAYRDGAR